MIFGSCIRKLYIYEHFSFCVRARMPFGLKDLDVEIAYLPNDDETTPIGMAGEKSLPILEDDTGYLGESLDIVDKVDKSDGKPVLREGPRFEITDWIDEWPGVVTELAVLRCPENISRIERRLVMLEPIRPDPEAARQDGIHLFPICGVCRPGRRSRHSPGFWPIATAWPSAGPSPARRSQGRRLRQRTSPGREITRPCVETGRRRAILKEIRETHS